MAKSKTVGEILGERVRYYRERATAREREVELRDGARDVTGITQDELAARTERFGLRMGRVTIANIEAAGRPGSTAKNRTRADNATLVDVLVLAAALDVSPPLLFVPLGETEEVAMGNMRIHPHLMFDWVAGDEPLWRMSTDAEDEADLQRFGVVPVGGRGAGSVAAWRENTQVITLFRELRTLQNRCDASESEVELVGRGTNAAVQERAARMFDEALAELDEHLAFMRRSGVTSVPDMPEPWAIRMAELRVMAEAG